MTFANHGSKRSMAEAETGYPQPDSSVATSTYGHHPYSTGYSVDQYNGMVKRPKTEGTSSPWGYSQAQASPGLYSHPAHSQPSYYEGVSSLPSVDYGFRTSGADHSYYHSRAQIDHYPHASQSLPYHTAHATHADITNGTYPSLRAPDVMRYRAS